MLQLSLNAKICIAATLLAVLSLGMTALVIGYKSSASAEAASMQLARTSAREVAWRRAKPDRRQLGGGRQSGRRDARDPFRQSGPAARANQ
ncbi:hypothetical protein LP419_19965 [Massilia sp. H-1]|nr:hypothetical protein LP419_19965 [Massilia sp. H-1]